MKNQYLWYIRKNNQETGPFPADQIKQFLLLGRYTLSDEISLDKEEWQTIATMIELIPDELMHESGHTETHRQIARRWADERQQERRESSRDPLAKDRRHSESQTERAYREKHQKVFKPPMGVKQKSKLMILLLCLLLIPFFVMNTTVKERLQPDCTAPAQPGVDWRNCSKEGITLDAFDMTQANLQNSNLSNSSITMGHLARANLEYANLSGAKLYKVDLSEAHLKGADLRRARLYDLDFHGADLSYVNFFNARLDNVNLARAKLEHAIWIDGRECGKGSIGDCNY